MVATLESLLGLKRNPDALTLLPLEYSPDGGLGFAVPALAYDSINAILDALQYPADVYSGERPVSLEDTLNFAGSVTGGASLGAAPQGALRAGAARTQKPKKPATPKKPERSSNINERKNEDIGLGGAVSKTAYRKDPDEYVSEQVQDLEFTPAVVRDPKDLYDPKGKTSIIPFVGDRTSTGQRIKKVNDMDLEDDYVTTGGYNFGRSLAASLDDPSIWASNPNVVKGLLNTAQRATDEGAERVLGVYNSMSGMSDSASHHVSDLLLRQLNVNPVSGQVAKEFTQDLNKLLQTAHKNKKKPRAPFPALVGHNSGKVTMAAEDWLDGATQGDRKLFVSLAESGKYQDYGFPDIAGTRIALTDKDLLHKSSGFGGNFIGEFDKNLTPSVIPRDVSKTYPAGIKGQYFGELETPTPFRFMFPRFNAGRRADDTTTGSDARSFSISSVTEPTDQFWLDTMMEYEDLLKQGSFSENIMSFYDDIVKGYILPQTKLPTSKTVAKKIAANKSKPKQKSKE